MCLEVRELFYASGATSATASKSGGGPARVRCRIADGQRFRRLPTVPGCPAILQRPTMMRCVLKAALARWRVGRLSCLGLLLVASLTAQDVLSIPVSSDGQPRPPPGVRLESIGVIDTLAGTGQQGDGGDGGPASQAEFRFPRSLALDPTRNIFVVDTRNHRIRRIDTAGVISEFAGTGQQGGSGDGGPASQAQLCNPAGVATDATGNVYVADSCNNRIRKIDAAGLITTIAGTGGQGSAGDNGPATEARLAQPVAVATDSRGNLYVAESGSHRIRRIDANGVITTFAGTGIPGLGGDGGPAFRAELSYPAGIAADPAGNVYIADSWNHRIRRVSSSGTISTFAGSGEEGDGGDGDPAVQAQLAYPAAVAPDTTGNIFVVSYVPGSKNHRIRKIDVGGIISAFAGAGGPGYGGDSDPAPAAQLAYPLGVAADEEGSVYIADTRNARVRVVRPGLQLSVALGTSGESVALVVSEGGVLERGGQPVLDGSEVTAGNGNSYSLSQRSDGIVVATYVPEEQEVRLTGGDVTITRDEHGTWRIDGESVGNGHRHLHLGREYVLELADGSWGLATYTIDTVAGTTEVTEGIPSVAATFSRPTHVAVDAIGNVYVTERNGYRIRRIDPSGIVTTFAGTGNWGHGGDGGPAAQAQLNSPAGMALDAVGNMYVAERMGRRIRRIDVAGTITTFAGTGDCCYSGDGGPSTEARFDQPGGIAVDSSGNVYVIDRGNERIRRIDPLGMTTTFAGAGEWGDSGDGGPAIQANIAPTGIALDSAGNVYLAQRPYHRVRRIDTEGVITTFAGTGEQGYGGDGGPASQAQLNTPRRVAVDSAGNVLVGDARNRRIRRIDVAGTITTFAGTGECCYSGDGGPAVEARLQDPTAIALDTAGNVYVTSHHRIRRIDTAGVITTLAGTGEEARSDEGGPAAQAQFQSPSAVALNASGELIFADHERVWKLGAAGEIIRFDCCEGEVRALALDSAGSVFAAEIYENRVVRIDVGGEVATFAGTGEMGYSGDGGPAAEAQLNRPCGLAVDRGGNVYVAERDNHRLRRIDVSGTITTFAGTGQQGPSGDGGPATEAQLDRPCSLAIDPVGNLYLADDWDQVRRIDAGGEITAIARIRKGIEALATDGSGNVYVGTERQVYSIESNGTISAIAGTGEDGYSGDRGPARSAGISVSGLAVNRLGDVWIADGLSKRIRVLRRQRQ